MAGAVVGEPDPPVAALVHATPNAIITAMSDR